MKPAATGSPRVCDDAVGLAQTLTVVAQRLSVGRPAGAPRLGLTAAALAITGGGPSPLLDRVQRLLGGNSRLRLAFPGRSLLLAVLVAAAIMTVLGSTAEVAVMAAEQILTPAQRVERMAELQKDYGEKTQINSDAAPRVLLSGTLHTESGEIPTGAALTALSFYEHTSTSDSLRLDAAGRFSQALRGNRALVYATAPGFAPAFSPLLAEANGQFPPAELVLRNGFAATVRLTDAANTPLAHVSVAFAYALPTVNATQYAAGQTLATDDAGRLVIPHAAAGAAQVIVDTDGYQYDEARVQLAEGQEATVLAVPAKKTNGVVLDSATGKPLANATIALTARQGAFGRTFYPNRTDANRAVPVAAADGQGRFAIDRLRDDCTYAFWVTAPDHGGEIIEGVRAGEKDLRWNLGPSRALRVEIQADEGKMPAKIWVNNPLRLNGGSYSYDFQLPVEIKDGVGVVEFADPIPGGVRFYAGIENAMQLRVDAGKPHGPLLLDLRRAALEQARAGQKKREVLVRIQPTRVAEGGAAPRGKLRVDYIQPQTPNSYTPGEVDVIDGVVRITVPVPTKFGYSQGQLVGYWIDEKREIAIPEGSDPFEITIQAEPAGAIFGKVLDEQGQPFTERFYVRPITVKQSPAVTDNRRPSMQQPFNSQFQKETYVLAPLPLEGVYRLKVAAGARVAVSDEIAVDDKHPIREVNLQFVRGVTVGGKVLGPAGTALGNIEVDLRFVHAGDESATSTRTDNDGRFAFEHVNPQVAGATYDLVVRPGNATQGLRRRTIDVTGKPYELKLVAGLTARGKVIDVDTRKPFGSRRVTLVPKKPDQAQYRWTIETTTNSNGEFEARGLEPIEYSIHVDRTYPKEAQIIRDPTGKPTSVRMTGDHPTLTGGQRETVELERVDSPW